MSETIRVYLESGAKRVFACAVDWPGWARAGRAEATALQALLDVAPRYAAALAAVGLAAPPPPQLADFTVVARLAGNATTDFGAPGAIAPHDDDLLSEAELARSRALLSACWAALDRAARRAMGQPLRQGPRGGGRNLEEILAHVAASERAYLGKFGGWLPPAPATSLSDLLARTRQASVEALIRDKREVFAIRVPRHGPYWPAHYFVRRLAWHALDHAWELEDRLASS